MDVSGKHPANNSGESGETVVEFRRSRGAPKGSPKPAGSGRKPGTRNKVTLDVKKAAMPHARKAFRLLARLMDESSDDRTKLAAARELLDRAFGRPISPQELTGANGAPLIPDAPGVSDIELAKAVANILGRAGVAEPAAAPPTPAALPAPQARPGAATEAMPEVLSPGDLSRRYRVVQTPSGRCAIHGPDGKVKTFASSMAEAVRLITETFGGLVEATSPIAEQPDPSAVFDPNGPEDYHAYRERLRLEAIDERRPDQRLNPHGGRTPNVIVHHRGPR